MSALAWALALLLPIALGWVVVRCLAPACPRGLALALGAALGPALVSIPFVGWLATRGPAGLAGAAAEALALAGLASIARRRAPAPSPSGPSPGCWTAAERALGAALVAVGGAFVVSFVGRTLASPHGTWDGWAIWNLRARTLARCGGDWSLVADEGAHVADHLDYPLALPGAIARAWGLTGESVLTPALLSLQAALAGAAIVGLALARARGRAAGLLGATLVLATPAWADQAAAQGADVPLATLLVAALALLTWVERAEGAGPGPLVLTGLAAGLAAWAKNEGLVAVVGVTAAAALVVPRARLRAGGLALLGAAPGLLAAALHKAAAPQNDLVLGQGAGSLARLLDPGRWALTLQGLGGAALAHWLAAALGLYVAVVGLRPAPRPRAAALGAAVLIVQLAAYALAYVTTPWDLSWHLATSRERVVLHLWPGAVLLALLVARAPSSDEDR